jgi:KDO2-lipid IV(A) lauroyltransferase
MHHLILPVIKLIGLFLHWMPAWFGRLCGDLFGLLWFDVVRLRRRLVLENIAIAFPDWDRKRRVRVGRMSMRNLGRAFMDLLALHWIDRDWMRKHVIFHGMENYERVPGRAISLPAHGQRRSGDLDAVARRHECSCHLQEVHHEAGQ